MKYLKQKLIKNANIGQSDEIFSDEFTAMSIGYLPWDGKLGKENHIVSEATSYFKITLHKNKKFDEFVPPLMSNALQSPKNFYCDHILT